MADSTDNRETGISFRGTPENSIIFSEASLINIEIKEESKMQPNKKLEELKNSGAISSWKIENIDSEGNVGIESDDRNSERLTITFPDGQVLEVNTLCSGYSENVVFC